MVLPSTLQSARYYVAQTLTKGGVALDATVGNGYDTLFLAEQVGPTGKVYGFDIQADAIHSTWARLNQAGQSEQVQLFQIGHHQMDEQLPMECKGNIDAMMFNLGYLPHGDPQVITQVATTLKALEIGTAWLKPGGIISVALYTGHPGGQEEADQVVNWASTLDAKLYQVIWQQILNRRLAPSLIVIEKRK